MNMFNAENFKELYFLVPFALVCAGIIIFIIQLVLMIKAYKSKFWEKTMGLIITSEQIRDVDHEGGVMHYSNIVYEYYVGNKKYTSKRIAFGEPIQTKKNSKKAVEKYPKGMEVVVYFNPQKENKSVLETGISKWNFFALFFALFYISAACLIGYVFMKANGKI